MFYFFAFLHFIHLNPLAFFIYFALLSSFFTFHILFPPCAVYLLQNSYIQDSSVSHLFQSPPCLLHSVIFFFPSFPSLPRTPFRFTLFFYLSHRSLYLIRSVLFFIFFSPFSLYFTNFSFPFLCFIFFVFC